MRILITITDTNGNLVARDNLEDNRKSIIDDSISFLGGVARSERFRLALEKEPKTENPF